MSEPPSRGRGRWVLALLALLFFGGMIASVILVESGWRPTRTKNHGELVQPARPLADVDLQRLDDGPVRLSELHGKWSLVYFGPAECLTPCESDLYKMRQVVAAQGREAYRVRRVFVITDMKAVDALRYTLKEYPGMEVLTGAPDEVARLAEQFRLPSGSPLDHRHRVYVIDPRGNFMMSYPADADPKGMNKDLSLLLRASQIG